MGSQENNNSAKQQHIAHQKLPSFLLTPVYNVRLLVCIELCLISIVWFWQAKVITYYLQMNEYEHIKSILMLSIKRIVFLKIISIWTKADK